jgi:hypothetical protein
LAVAAIGFWGCSPEGTGTIKVSPEARAKIGGDGDAAPKKKLTSKQAKAQELIDAAAKKNPKLQ